MLVKTKTEIQTYNNRIIPSGVIDEVQLQLPTITDEHNNTVHIHFESNLGNHVNLIVTYDEFKDLFEKI